ncbi:uncharacterized protein EAF01_001626 [Botrytis porri]|uniref:uncharacterized protein n=1 Tax=Botrytis porri TaxID=87229 RepID=UPI001902B9A1|nr:uncharacterized protein EAF01_001626 [Botrytis porri]KAF7912605.1 hypothetical protein EAF01_001626 [Botrytis porri]
MCFSTPSIATLGVALRVTHAQTPADSWLIIFRNIARLFFGNITVTPGKWISPSNMLSAFHTSHITLSYPIPKQNSPLIELKTPLTHCRRNHPTLYLPPPPPSSISPPTSTQTLTTPTCSSSDFTTPSQYPTLIPCLASNTTTRPHWWQGNYTISPPSLPLSLSPSLPLSLSPSLPLSLFLTTSNSITALPPSQPTQTSKATPTHSPSSEFPQPGNYYMWEEAVNVTYYAETTARFIFFAKGDWCGRRTANWFAFSL